MAQPGETSAGAAAPPRRHRRLPREPPAAGDGLPLRGHQRHDGDRWRRGLGDQCRAPPVHLALVRESRRSPGLCILRRHLRRRFRRLRRRPGTGGAGKAAPAQPVRLDEARLRSPRRTCRRDPPAAPAAVGRAQVLQRLWPERVPQGRHDLGGEDQARRGGRRRAGPAVPVDRARSRRRRAAARLHLGGRRGRCVCCGCSMRRR